MSFFSSLFGKKNDEDYATILSTLSADIQKRQAKLSEIRLRERRATLQVTLYTLSGWIAYVGVWYTGLLQDRMLEGRFGKSARVIKALPVILGPIIILFVRRLVQIWYARKGDQEEKTLREVRKKQHTKLEEIKKKTDYYATRELLQKYDENTPAGSPLRPGVQNAQATPPRGPPSSSPMALSPPTPNTRGRLSIPNAPQSAPPVPPVQSGPVRKQWFDKLADKLLGEDDEPRYALICEKCFSHNGLVKESVWEETKYVCPRCKHLNTSISEKRRGSSHPSPSPISPSTSSSSKFQNFPDVRRQPSGERGGLISPKPKSGDQPAEMDVDT